MKRYKYKNYNDYILCQEKAFHKKINNIWAVEANIKFIAEYLKNMNPLNGLCHGVRQGYEQEWFNQVLPDCRTIGSELGGILAVNTVKWDFNMVNPDWVGGFDFIYSNSFDHAFEPISTLNIWANQLKENGVIILEYDKRQEHTGEISMPANKTDPLSITVDELIEKIPEWLPGMKVIDVLDLPVVKIEFQKAVVIGYERKK